MTSDAAEEPHTLTQRLGFELPSDTTDGVARARALAARLAAERTPTSLVSYVSRGKVLVVDRDGAGRDVVDTLAAGLRCTLLITDVSGAVRPAGDTTQAEPRSRTLYAPLKTLRGHLGGFHAIVDAGGQEVDLGETLGEEDTSFDIVLDLLDPPTIRREILPPGYYAPGADEAALERALGEIPEMVGEFEKPKFFRYDPDICAHGSNGLRGCTRCIDRCPTTAIASLGERIEVDPFLCQGAGSCATACPTGAITYAYPTTADVLEGLRVSLGVYRDAGGSAPVVLFYDMELGREWVGAHASALPERVLPCAVEEIGSVGLDVWMGALAYGASSVGLLCTPAVPGLVVQELEEQLSFAHAMLRGLGLPAEALGVVAADTSDGADVGAVTGPEMPTLRPASFSAPDEKRTTIRLALDHLYRETRSTTSFVGLPENAPFGELSVQDGCTLCMACVSTCPAAALEAGGDAPRLSFIEMNCVQCGLCESACPEDVIVRRPRFLFDVDARRARRTLNEEAPFNCIGCGKPFATQSIMNRMREKLSGHWMFEKPEALRRLEMCEDCRVKDMMREGDGTLRL